jgi:toxin ParE1/3/4
MATAPRSLNFKPEPGRRLGFEAPPRRRAGTSALRCWEKREKWHKGMRPCFFESRYVSVGLNFTKQLRQQGSKPADLPGALGRARPELRSDIRSFAFRGYVISFRYAPDVLEVVDIQEGHRDIEGHFADGKP